MTLDTNFIKKFEENFSHNVNLSNYSWFNLGGNAEYFFKAKNKKQLIEFLRESKKQNLNTSIVNLMPSFDHYKQGAYPKLVRVFKCFGVTNFK